MTRIRLQISSRDGVIFLNLYDSFSVILAADYTISVTEALLMVVKLHGSSYFIIHLHNTGVVDVLAPSLTHVTLAGLPSRFSIQPYTIYIIRLNILSSD